MLRIAVRLPPQVIGKNTVHAMQSGLFYGYAGMVDSVVGKTTAASYMPLSHCLLK